ncbi:MAG TPA: hypothetical protein VHY75_09220 [Steroidobacteraceae bacterium]|jgi:hypothetical protein|nr:hypothetical protein [Steroidobacteraceae bacterium]
MQPAHRPLLLGFVALCALSGCDLTSPWGSSSSGTAYGSASVTDNTGGTGKTGGSATSPVGGVGTESSTTGTDDTVVATASSVSVSVEVGSSQITSITFTSSDGLAITGFGITGTLGVLPAGWSGPSTFTCKLVMAGSACVLDLTYAPTALGSGSLVVNYEYVDNASLSKAPGGSVTIAYQAIAQNNAVATAMPSGQINAAVGRGTQSVSVNFTSDSSNAVLDQALTDLTITTDLGSLPPGWSSASPAFSCAIVTTGNGCQLMLSYAPTAAGRGVLGLSYTYVDDSGAARSGTLNIPYATTSSNNVVATASPAGQIEAVEKTGSQAVAVAFNTDDGRSASGLILTSNLSALPAGWHSSATSFTCASIGTGNGCELPLTYAPAALGSGMLRLDYAYSDDAGNQQTGTLNVPYTATTNDNVVATPSPTGQITAVVGQGSQPGQGTQPVAVTFTTDDTRLATALQITSDLTLLPSGWSAPSAFTCTTVSTGGGCQLDLAYTPTVYTAPGTLVLGYSYKNNAGQTKTGSIDIPYRALTDDTITGTLSPSSPLAVIIGSPTAPTPVTVTFVTDDGEPAIGIPSTSNALTITSGLNSLPPGWTASSTFGCLTVSDGTTCQLPLSYQPTQVTNGAQILTLGYSYVNDAGYGNTGTVMISYRAMSDNSVLGAPNPSSVLDVASGGGTATVVVSFTTSDGNPASMLALSPLPSGIGWSVTSPSTCAMVGGSATCQLSLSYLPAAPTGGVQTLTLGYQYINNAGQSGSGSLAIQYSAT